MPAALDLVNYLVDLLTAKNFLGIESATVTSDSSVVILINSVSKWFRNKTNGRQLRQSSIIEYRDGNGLKEMFTKAAPVVSASVYIDQDFEWGDDTKIAAASMIVDSETGLITLKKDIFELGTKNVKITYLGGFEDPLNDAPDLAEAALWMIKKLWDPKAATVSSVSLQGGSTAYFDSVAPKWVLDVLERYRREL